MSRARPKQSPWREALDEVNGQQTLMESALHPEQKSSERPRSVSFATTTTTSSSQAKHAIEMATAPRERSSSQAKMGAPFALLSPNFDAADGEGKQPGTAHSVYYDDLHNDEERDVADNRRVASVAEGNSKVVDALVEALSTSSWSSESNTALPAAPDESSPAPHRPETSEAPAEAVAHSASSKNSENFLSHTIAAQYMALCAAPFYLRATQIAASEFEARQHIMFTEFMAVTELISLFVCRMSQTTMRS